MGFFYSEDDLENKSDEIIQHATDLEKTNQALIVNLLERVATREINGQMALKDVGGAKNGSDRMFRMWERN
jgi:hypothetical protein